MLSFDPDNVRFMIERLRELQATDALEHPDGDLPTSGPSDEAATSAPTDPVLGLEGELRATLQDLEPDQRNEVRALLWVGRGDFEADDWSAAVIEARAHGEEPLVELLLDTPLAGEYLEEGLSRHGYAAA